MKYYVLLLLLMLPMAFAQVHVPFVAQSGILLQDNTVDLLGDVTDYHMLSYVCANQACSEVQRSLADVQSSGNSAQLDFMFPAQLQSPYGYVLYFFKPGYITWEARADLHGTGSIAQQHVSLLQAESCRAHIDEFEVINELYPNQPLMIDIASRLSATTQSALQKANPHLYVPSMLAEYYKVQTQIRLEIVNVDTQQVVHTETRIYHINASDTVRTQFSWTPQDIGRYQARVTSDVIDTKCASSFESSSSKGFNVITQNPKEMCYVLINNLQTRPVNGRVGDLLNISFDTVSQYYDDIGQLYPIDANVTVDIRYLDSIQYHASRMVFSGTHEFGWTPLVGGEHHITVLADVVCPYDDVVVDVAEQTYFVRGSTRPEFDALPPITLFKNSGFNQDILNLSLFARDADNDPLTFTIVGQSDEDVVFCGLHNAMLSCTVAQDTIGQSNVTISVTDGSTVEYQDLLVSVVERRVDSMMVRFAAFDRAINDT
ncbi:MAG: hypothetical protein ACMXYC_04060, partial [Candidatus Woesearchaeota archaeon]